jgi:hypothetical protein
MEIRTKMLVLGIALGMMGITSGALAEAVQVPTAKNALAIANGSVDEGVKDQVISFEGTSSDSTLQPRQWDVVLYDPARSNGGTIVRVKDGAVMSVGASVRMFDDARWKKFGRNFTGYDLSEIINMGRWTIDSDKLIASVIAIPKLANIQVTEVKLMLRKLSDGDVPPIWTITLRARPKHNPSRERWIGNLQVNAESGEVITDNLNVDALLR